MIDWFDDKGASIILIYPKWHIYLAGGLDIHVGASLLIKFIPRSSFEWSQQAQKPAAAMGGYQTKDRTMPSRKAVEGLQYKVKLLQGEVSEIICLRDAEIEAYDREMMVFAFKEAEWKKERKKLREEVKKLRKQLECREERFKGMENEFVVDKSGNKWHFLGPSFLFEEIREEQARRDDAVEKWKHLYFAIKVELDDLIQRTNQGIATLNKSLM